MNFSRCKYSSAQKGSLTNLSEKNKQSEQRYGLAMTLIADKCSRSHAIQHSLLLSILKVLQERQFDR